MSDHDDDLTSALQDYYRAVAQQPAPDVTERVMMSTDRRAVRIRRWTAIGGGVLAAAAVGAVVAVAFVNHKQGSPVGPAHSATPAPTATVAPSSPSSPSPSVAVTMPNSPPFVGGPAVQGFVPTDVTAISADQWWVLGFNGPTCTSASCTRIVHTTDGGSHFTSTPVPPVAPAQNGQQALRLRFADTADGWLVDANGQVWATHDGAEHWTSIGNNTRFTDLEASGGSVYAIGCPGTNCWIERSPTTHDSWMVLPASEGGSRRFGHLNVNGTHVWVTFESPAGEPGLVLESTDSGQSFGKYVICGSALGFPDLYADDISTLWTTCATGTQAAAYRSTDGGQSFTQLTGSLSLPNFATIAGVSQTTAVIAGQGLIRTTDGGHTFATVQSSQSQWTVVGFTTPQDGFAFDIGSAQSQLWRTDDAGAHWRQVTFP
jgi:photosystem II stability/assembly factor-like uncharacterized protein